MTISDDKKPWEESGEGESGQGDSGQGGKSGEIQFKWITSLSEIRDDQLSPEERRRRLLVHKDLHIGLVGKAQKLRQYRDALKKGLITSETVAYQYGFSKGGGGDYSPYKKHPIADKFHGMRDKQELPFPSENKAQTELVNQLQNRYEKRLNYTHNYTPTLKRY